MLEHGGRSRRRVLCLNGSVSKHGITISRIINSSVLPGSSEIGERPRDHQRIANSSTGQQHKKESAILERVGSKATRQKEASVELLGEEISHAINCLISLANHYQIDLEKVYNSAS